MATYQALSDSWLTTEQLPSWTFDPERSEAGFCARLMGSVWVNGCFKDVRGKFFMDWEHPLASSCFGEIDATKLYAGEPRLNTLLRAADFFRAQSHPKIMFGGRLTERTDENSFKAEAHLTLRGNTHPMIMDVTYVGQWAAPLWRDGENRGTVTRVGLKADGLITRAAFDAVAKGGTAPGRGLIANVIEITLYLEAMLDADLETV